MSALYALLDGRGQPYTLGGRLLVHDSRDELEWLFPGRLAREVTGTTWPTRPWKDHPGMAGIRFPLRREDFIYG